MLRNILTNAVRSALIVRSVYKSEAIVYLNLIKRYFLDNLNDSSVQLK